MKLKKTLALAVLALWAAGPAWGQPAPGAGRMVTQGLATPVIDNLFRCGVPVANHRIAAVGRITASDGTVLTVPAPTLFQRDPNAPRLPDLFNECARLTPATLGEVDLASVPIVDIDADGEVVTATLIADNYYEMYVNGRLVGIDSVPYTPFNSQVVRFRVRRPYTLAFLLVDWEEKLGLGMERFPNTEWHAGDGGFIARFSDGVVTDAGWRGQSFYIAPLGSPDEVVERGQVHDTSALGRVHPQARIPDCRERCYAVHYPIPADWMMPDFDDRHWPMAHEYTDEEIGVGTLTAYTRYPEAFAGARWIWTINLVFDNTVILRRTVR
jgi:hypothetical protein